MKLKFNEIKADIRNGYEYMEYEQKYRGEEVTTILNTRENTVTTFTWGYYGQLEFTTEEFLKLDYKEYRRKYNEFMFYAPTVEESGDLDDDDLYMEVDGI